MAQPPALRVAQPFHRADAEDLPHEVREKSAPHERGNQPEAREAHAPDLREPAHLVWVVVVECVRLREEEQTQGDEC